MKTSYEMPKQAMGSVVSTLAKSILSRLDLEPGDSSQRL